MLPSDPTIVRFSFACLLLSLVACAIPIAVSGRDSAESAVQPASAQVSPSKRGPAGEAAALMTCAAAPPICGSP
jgi:hypothetical protein